MIQPVVRQRALDAGVLSQAEQNGYTKLQARILAGRIHGAAGLSAIDRPVADLDPPDALPDIEAGATAIADAITGKTQTIVLCTDHDCDGSSSHFVLRTALLDYLNVPAARVVSFITHRMKEGYGVSDKVVDRMLAVAPPGSLCITADQGSTDETRIARMHAEKNITTVVTDHHGIPAEGPPKSALACVNPARGDSKFDPYIAGCAVAWLTMCAVRQKLIARGWLPKDAPSLAPLLDVVAVGTCADAVSLGASKNNRSILAYGLRRINSKAPRACWEAMRAVMNKQGPLTVRDLSHGIAPRINARGRLGDAMASVRLLCAKTLEEALPIAEALDADNKARREIQNAMTGPAMEIGGKQAAAGRAALVVHLVHGHSGVHGIVASRLVETYGRPVCCLSPNPNAPEMVSGSLRSIPSVDIRAALVHVSEHNPGLLPHFGGHRGAAGLGLARKEIDRFSDALCEAVAAQADPSKFAPVIWTDGNLPVAPSLDALAEVEALEPYGREFESPQFCDMFTVAEVRPVGDGSHLKLDLVGADGEHYGAIWFRAMDPGTPPPVSAGEQVPLVYTLSANTFRGQTKLDLVVVAVSPQASPVAHRREAAQPIEQREAVA